jgi:hypothetical protein
MNYKKCTELSENDKNHMNPMKKCGSSIAPGHFLKPPVFVN